MKLTEEQKKAIQCLKETLGYPVVSDGTFENNHYVDRKEYVGISDEAYLDGINEVIERVEGIPWQPYPAIKPNEDGKFLAVALYSGYEEVEKVLYRNGSFMSLVGFGVQDVSHWAEINLPTKKA